MRIACLTFTQNGQRLAFKLKDRLEEDVHIFFKENFKKESGKDFKEVFKGYDGIIFISSTGIAVRFIAPYLEDKASDPAVVVVDDMGRYAISLLSGHIGGANELSRDAADAIGGQAIITTASDGRGIESIDIFAKRHNLYIESLEDAKILTAMMVDGKSIEIISEEAYDIGYKNIVKNGGDGYIVVSSTNIFEYKKPYCVLRPRNLNIGIGCKKGKSTWEIMEAMALVFNDNNLCLKSVKSMGTIDLKKDEEGIIEASKNLRCPLKIFSKRDIEGVQYMFKGSTFVLDSVGVTSVAEPCAYLLGGEIIVERRAINGITISVSKEVYSG